MADIDELSRLLGNIESSIETLFHKHTDLCKEVKLLKISVQDEISILSSCLQKRRFWDTLKILSGAFIGGFGAVIAKMMIWK